MIKKRKKRGKAEHAIRKVSKGEEDEGRRERRRWCRKGHMKGEIIIVIVPLGSTLQCVHYA